MNRYLLGLVSLLFFFTASAQIPDYGIRGVRIGSNPSTARPDSLVLLGQNRDAGSATYGLGKWQGFFMYADGDSLCIRVGGDTVCINGAITNPGMANADSSIVIVDDYTELKALVTNANFAFVTDSLWGGFFYQDASGTPDSALIVDGAGDREWVRIVEDNKYWLTWWINNDTTWEDELQRAINLISDRHGEYGTGTLYIPYVDTAVVSDTYTYWLDTVGVDPFDTFDIKDVKYCVELKSNMAIIIDERATLKLIDSLVVFGDSTNRVNIFIADSIQNVSITGGTIDGNASGQYQEAPGYYGIARYGNIFHLYDTAEVWGNEYLAFNKVTLQNHSGNGIYFEHKAQKINLQDVQQYGLIDSATVQHIHYMHIMRADSNVMDGFHLIDSTEIITNVLDSAQGSWIFRKINPIQAGNDAIWVEFQTSNEYVGDAAQTNITMNRGFNLGPGGGALVSGIPAWGESIEFHFAPDATHHYVEWHDLFIDSSGVQHRVESKVIDKGDFTTWSKYYTLNQLALHDPMNDDAYFSVIRNDSTGVYVNMLQSDSDRGFKLFSWPTDNRVQLQSYNNPGTVTFDIFQDKPFASIVNVEYLNYQPSGAVATTAAGRDASGFITGITYPVLWDSLNNHFVYMDNFLLAASGTGGTESITDGETVTIADDITTIATRSTNTVTVGVDTAYIATQYDLTTLSGMNGIYSSGNNDTDAAVTEINVASGNDIIWDIESNSSTDRFIISSAIPIMEFNENDDGVDWIWYQDAGAFAFEPEGGNDSWRIGTNGGGNLFNVNTSTRDITHYGGTFTFDNGGFATDPIITLIKDDTETAEMRWLNGSYLRRWALIGTAAADMDLRIGRYTGSSVLADYPLTILNSNGVVRILNSGGAATTLTGRDTDEGVTDVTVGYGLDLTSGTLLADTAQLATQYDLTLITGSTDHDFYEVGGTDPPNAISDNIFKSSGTTHLGGSTAGAQTLHVTGTARITASDGTATSIMGRDADGDVSTLSAGAAFTISAGTLNWNGLLINGDAGSVTLNSSGTLAGGLGLASSGSGTTMTVNMNIGELDVEAAPEGDEMIVIYDANDSPTHEQIELDEAVSDVVGAMVTGNTETAISVTYDDTDNTLDFVVSEVDGSTTNEAWTIDADAGGTEVISNQTVMFQGSGSVSTSYDAGTGILLIDGATGSGTFGTDNQVPFVNAGGTDFDYDADFTFNGTDLAVGLTDLYVDGAGNMVGINDATPDHTLDIHQASDATDGIFIESSTTADEAATINLRGRQDGTDFISSSITFSNFDDDGGATSATASLANITVDRSVGDDEDGILRINTFKINASETEHIRADAVSETTLINGFRLPQSTTAGNPTMGQTNMVVNQNGGVEAVTVTLGDADIQLGTTMYLYAPQTTGITWVGGSGDTVVDNVTDDQRLITIVAVAANLWVAQN